MIEPLSLSQLGLMLQQIINVFDDYLYFAFVIFVTINVCYGIQKILVGRSV